MTSFGERGNDLPNVLVSMGMPAKCGLFLVQMGIPSKYGLKLINSPHLD